MIASHAGVLAGAAVTIALGAILSIMGYEDLWSRRSAASAPRRRKPGHHAQRKRPRRKQRR